MTTLYKLRHGGLFRCCIASLDEHMAQANAEPKEGDTLRCRYCKDEYGMIFHDGAWQWAKPRE